MATIVLVEDDDDLRTIYAQRLRAAGHEVVEVACGLDVCTTAREAHPHLILLDLFLPGLNGLEVLQRLRDEPLLVGVPVVMISAAGEADARLESFSLGAVDYWTKTLSLDDLAERVARRLAQASA